MNNAVVTIPTALTNPTPVADFMSLAEQVSTVDDLVRELSRPALADIEFAERINGDVLVLGAAGKMGPTLVRRVAAAFQAANSPHRVHAVSRFSDPSARSEIESAGVHTISMDLMSDDGLHRLPDVANVIYLVGMKFGSTGQEPRTWAVNTFLPGRVANRFRNSRIVALSTGNVYGDVQVESGGAVESDSPSPVGEYAQSCLGRERLFQHFSLENRTPTCLIRLNYAVEARYGVLLDIATKVFRSEPVSLDVGYVNVIWQGDANSVCFRALDHCSSPATILNVTGADRLSVRDLAVRFGDRFGIDPIFCGEEKPTALLSNPSECMALFGEPLTPVSEVVDLVAKWVQAGGDTHGKPTKFEKHDGRF